jgi:chemotaxis methyl-accepting protein methylase
VQRFFDYLEPGGYLFLGHAESTSRADVKFQTHIYRDAQIYQKPATLQRTMAAQERA